MGGSPEPTVEKIKNLVYMDPNYKRKEPLRAEYLGELAFAQMSWESSPNE